MLKNVNFVLPESMVAQYGKGNNAKSSLYQSSKEVKLTSQNTALKLEEGNLRDESR